MSSSLSRFENARKRQIISNRKKANWFLADSSPGNDSSAASMGDSTAALDHSVGAVEDAREKCSANETAVKEEEAPEIAVPVTADRIVVVAEGKGESSTSDSCSSPQQQQSPLLPQSTASPTPPSEPAQTLSYNFLVDNFYGKRLAQRQNDNDHVILVFT